MALPPRAMASLIDSGSTQGGPMTGAPAVDIEIEEPRDFGSGAVVTSNPDGSAVVSSMEELIAAAEAAGIGDIPHDANLAEYLDEAYLSELSTQLRAAFDEDLESRSEWEETYTKGLDLLGVKTVERSEPFEGASSVTHPLISESVTQFQAQAYKELLPAGGPVSTKVLGAQDSERESQAARVKHFMNYQITEIMEEYDPDMDQMLFYLPLSGSTFKKTYWDNALQRAVSRFVPAQDLVVPYSASDLQTSPRVTHIVRMDANDLRKNQVSGFYRDVDLRPSHEAPDEVRKKIDDIQGTSKTYSDDVHTLLEMHVNLDIEGFEDLSPEGEPTGIQLPYIVTLDKDSGTVLGIRRNFDEGTELAVKRQYFVHYKFLPGLGFYGFGLVHMIGGLGRASTSILRQLIDAGTFANLPAGFKARGVRVRDNDEPLQPGEFRDVDAPGGNLRDAIIPLPYKEPSGTLAQLLGALVEAGRRYVSVADLQTGNMNQEAPVGTTVALLERGMKVMSAIHKRLHYAQKLEFRILAKIFADNLPPEYPYEVAGAPRTVFAADFDARVDVIPVSDPNIFSMAQRVTLAQTQLQLAQSNPNIHNLHEAYRRMYQALEVQDIEAILPPPPQPQPTDPMIENGRALTGSLLQAFPDQDHDAHIRIHLAFMRTPLVMTSPQVMATFYAHLMEHVSLKVRNQVTQQVSGLAQQALASGNDPALAQQLVSQLQQQMQNPGEVEKLVAAQAEESFGQVISQLLPQGNDPMADPLVQIRMQELAIKQQTEQRKAQMEQAQLTMDAARLQQQAVSDAARLELNEQIADERNDVNRERIAVQRQAVMARGAR